MSHSFTFIIAPHGKGKSTDHVLEMDGKVIGTRNSLNRRYTAAVVCIKTNKGPDSSLLPKGYMNPNVETWASSVELARKAAASLLSKDLRYRHRRSEWAKNIKKQFIVVSAL